MTTDEAVQSPVDQLIPITEGLVNNVEKTLQAIVQEAMRVCPVSQLSSKRSKRR